MLDAITFETRGIPAVVVITEPFKTTTEAMARMAGMAGYPYVMVPHPFSNLKQEQVNARAEDIADRVERLLLGN